MLGMDILTPGWCSVFGRAVVYAQKNLSNVEGLVGREGEDDALPAVAAQ